MSRRRAQARRGLALALALSLSSISSIACAARLPPPRQRPQAAAEEGQSPLPDPVHAPISRPRGEVLDLTVPLVDGDGLPLSELRGRVVVLELTATWVASWPETYAFYNRLLAEHAGQLAVVVVTLDNERGALSPEPGTRAPGFTLGWDPQGALAARLQAAALPTVVVLDRAGEIVHAQGGAAEGSTATLELQIREALR
ncbi:MAG: hypothetical protein R3A51_21310 [Nannocystaceae bacterium]